MASPIDRADMITMPHGEDASISGWLLSSPTTVIFSKLDLSETPLRVMPVVDETSLWTQAAMDALAFPFPPSMRGSVSSDCSAPGMSDGRSSSASDASSYHHNHSTPRDGDVSPREELWEWDSWLSKSDYLNEPSAGIPRKALLSRTSTSELSQLNRNYATTNLSSLNLSKDPVFEPLRLPLSQPKSMHNLRQPTYSPFPSSSTARSPLADICTPSYTPHKSWPTRKTSRPALVLFRCKTGPSHAATPSTLSAYTSCESPPLSSGIFMRSSSTTDRSHDIEQSAFEDSDDEDDKSGPFSFVTKTMKHGGKGGSLGRNSKPEKKPRAYRRSASEVLRGYFRRSSKEERPKEEKDE